MFGKLLKHEFIATRRLVPMIWLATAVMAAINILSSQIDIGWLGGTSMVFLILLAVGQVVVTYAVVVTRYYRSLYSNEGYLTHTLPVKASQLLGSKLMTSFIWLILSYIIAFAVFVVIIQYFAQQQGISLIEVYRNLQATMGFENSHAIVAAVIIILFLFYSLTFQLSQLFFAMSFGSLSRFHKLSLAAPILSYLAINFLLEILTMVAMLFVPLSIEIKLNAGGLPASGLKIVGQGMHVLLRNPQEERVLIGLGGIILTLFVICGLLWGCHRLIKNHTSLR
jgi:hypothetical protein